MDLYEDVRDSDCSVHVRLWFVGMFGHGTSSVTLQLSPIYPHSVSEAAVLSFACDF